MASLPGLRRQFFSSYWVIIPAFAVIILTIIRMVFEDRTLKEELPGYREYIEQVRYRSLPGNW
ncbi:MAG: hypothetical protein ABIJ65_14115 [Chloroflexota bacterium]